ncbi:MAG TPA: aminoglycoside phosphotransferase family protein, partial [Verrucomicrobium sp.]|nr:aminoglycoside phosphotransferase family protein [Verrucomicrobium sp.]
RVTMSVPQLELLQGGWHGVFSRHAMLKGDHLTAADYALLSEGARQRLARELALFYMELHAIDPQFMRDAGARPVCPWLSPEEILTKVRRLLPARQLDIAEQALVRWQSLPPDTYGTTYGFFDGHGWNMAFDHERQQLNGIYDFADSGFGDLHQEFIYSNFVSPDLTSDIIAEYEQLTGRRIDRQRIHLLTGVLRLSELAEVVDDVELMPVIGRKFEEWCKWDEEGSRS